MSSSIKRDDDKIMQAIADACHQLRLPAFYEEIIKQEQDPSLATQGTIVRVDAALKAELISRKNKRFQRMLKESGINDVMATIDKITFESSRGLNEGLVKDLATCNWLEVEPHLNVIITGKTGCGKSWLAKALGKEAISHGFSTWYWRTAQLCERMNKERADNQSAQFRSRLQNRKLIIIDDFAMTPMSDALKDDFLSFLEERENYGSLIIASQRRFDDWYNYIGGSYHSDAIMDRLKNNSYVIELKGRSLRESRENAKMLRELNKKLNQESEA